MFKISTTIIKAQLPHLTLNHLLHFYQRELHTQNLSFVSINLNTIKFSNNLYKFTINRYANKFSSFSSGQIEILETENEFAIYMQANMSRLFYNTGIISIALIVFLFFDEFNLFPIVLGLAAFILLTLLGYIFTKISFPIYFITLRNKIELELAMMN